MACHCHNNIDSQHNSLNINSIRVYIYVHNQIITLIIIITSRTTLILLIFRSDSSLFRAKTELLHINNQFVPRKKFKDLARNKNVDTEIASFCSKEWNTFFIPFTSLTSLLPFSNKKSKQKGFKIYFCLPYYCIHTYSILLLLRLPPLNPFSLFSHRKKCHVNTGDWKFPSFFACHLNK